MNNNNNSNNSEKEPLFHRFNVEEEIVFDNERTSTDLTNGDGGGGINDFPLDKILDAFGGILDNADRNLEEISTAHNDNGNMLGTAIVRGCTELANVVGHIAQELEQQTESDRRALAEACLEDAAVALVAQQQKQEQQAITQQQQELALMSPDDLMSALAGVSPLLRDVEVGLRSIDQTEADEIADVALTLARLFVASLQSFHSSMVHNLEQQQDDEERRQQQLESDRQDRFELLLSDDDDDDDEPDKNDSSDATIKEQQESKRRKQRNDNNDNDNKQRMRVLWPPLGPAVAKACDWGKNEAIQRPILAVALGMTLWPAAVATTVLGVVPLVAVDSIIQNAYTSNRNGPIVSNIERGALQIYQAGKLSFLCGKLVTRQTLRVLHRQIDRNGGIGPIVENLIGIGIDKVCHPIETVTEVWGGLNWAWDIAKDNWKEQQYWLNQLNPMMMMNTTNNNTDERRDATEAQAGDDCWR